MKALHHRWLTAPSVKVEQGLTDENWWFAANWRWCSAFSVKLGLVWPGVRLAAKKSTTDRGLLRESPQTDASNVVERNHNFVPAEVNHNASPRVFTAFNVKFVKTFWTKLVSLCPQIGERNANLNNYLTQWSKNVILQYLSANFPVAAPATAAILLLFWWIGRNTIWQSV